MITLGQPVRFDCTHWGEPCARAPHTGTVERVYEVTPTLSIIWFTDQHGEQLTVSNHELLEGQA